MVGCWESDYIHDRCCILVFAVLVKVLKSLKNESCQLAVPYSAEYTLFFSDYVLVIFEFRVSVCVYQL